MKREGKMIVRRVAVMLLLAVVTATTAWADDEFTPDPLKLYFDVNGTGWEMGDRDKVGFYVFRSGEEPTLSWGSKKLQGTKVDGEDNIWQFDPASKGICLNEGVRYQIIFVHCNGNNWGDQTYPLVMDTSCLGSDENGGKPRSRQHNVWDEDWDEE